MRGICSNSLSLSSGVLLCVVLAWGGPKAIADILVSDDFSAVGSGTGWQGGSVYGTNSLLIDGKLQFGDTGARRFETPIDLNVLGRVYVAMDYAQITPGDGTSWGGLTMYEADNAEAFFLGNPWLGGGPGNYGIGSGGMNDLDSGVPITPAGRRLTAEITHFGTDIRFRLWDEGNTDLNAPTAEHTVAAADSSIDAPWAFLAFRADGNTTNTVDNLVIATSALDVNLTSSVVFNVDRSTGQLTIDASSSQAGIVGYTIESPLGTLSPGGWTSVAGNYDTSSGGNGSVDDTPWAVDQADNYILRETALDPQSVDGATIGGSTINLGAAVASSPYFDLRATALLSDGTTLEAIVQYSGQHVLGDLSGDGSVDLADWAIFKANGGSVHSGMSRVESYLLGDLNGDLEHDLTDFHLFQQAFDNANGAGAFHAALSGTAVPEPGTLVLAGLLMVGAGASRFGKRLRGLCLVAVASMLGAGNAHAVIFVEDTFSFEGSGSGWKENDVWGILSGGTANTNNGGSAMRLLEQPIEPWQEDKIYIALDFKAQNGMHWGGLSFFTKDGSPDSGGDFAPETLFIGKPSPIDAYGVDLKNGSDTPPVENVILPVNGMGELPLPVNGEFRRMILEIDFDDDLQEPYADTYSLWIDNYDRNAPQWSVTIETSKISQWSALRIARGSNENQIEIDNLVITNEIDVAFGRALELVVDTTTGSVSIHNDNTYAIDIDSYTIRSAGNSLNVGATGGDYNGDGTVDAADYTVWRNNLGAPEGTLPNDPNGGVIGSAQYATWKANFGSSGGGEGGWAALAEQDLAGFPAGSGNGLGWEMAGDPSSSRVSEYYLLGNSTLAAGMSVGLGEAYLTSVDAQDLEFIYQVNGEQRTGRVTYIASGALLSTTAAVPEPSTVLLLAGCMTLLGLGYRYRQSL